MDGRAAVMAKQRVEAKVYPDRGGKFRWRIRARNRKIVAVSGEAFASERNAERAVLAFTDAIMRMVFESMAEDEKARGRLRKRVKDKRRRG
jgi:uncharacterized protein YegP (UPF0339 family)